jgi:hypothetical protein
MSQHPISVSTGKFSLDISGVAGFFGGDEAIQAMQTIHLYKARRWTGWYNAPGSFAIAKCLGPIANSRFWNALFPGPNQDPEEVFGLNNQSGPKYFAPQSGTIIDKTTHITYLITQKSKEVQKNEEIVKVGRRRTRPMTLTVVEVKNMSQPPALERSKEPPKITVKVQPHHVWLCSIPISASIIACALCAYSRDWYCFAMVLLGIVSNGLTCLVVGSAFVILKGVKPADHVPPGDGMLMDDSSNHIVILKGKERDVNWVTKGRFGLEYLPHVWMKKKRTGSSDTEKAAAQESRKNSDIEKAVTQESGKKTLGPEEHRKIGLCGLLLGMQSLLQVLLIPQGTLFGQIMFLSSFIISWVYNLYLSSLDKEKVQQKLLSENLNTKATSRFELGTRTIAVVFATLVLQPLPFKLQQSSTTKLPSEPQPPSSVDSQLPSSDEPQPPSSDKSQPPSSDKTKPPSSIDFLKRFLPNETVVWEEWRKHIGQHIETTNWSPWTDESCVAAKLESLIGYEHTAQLSEEQKSLLKELLKDAEDAFRGYYNYLKNQPGGQGVDEGGRNSRPSPSSQRHASGSSKTLSGSTGGTYGDMDVGVVRESYVSTSKRTSSD